MNKLLELKMRELSLLNQKFEFIDNKFLIAEEKGMKTLLGCTECYGEIPEATSNGYKISTGNLINLGEKYSNFEKISKDVANNLWLCPACNRPFMELVPQYKIGNTENVSL
jgi:protein-arginine kinase activator protein McsA